MADGPYEALVAPLYDSRVVVDTQPTSRAVPDLVSYWGSATACLPMEIVMDHTDRRQCGRNGRVVPVQVVIRDEPRACTDIQAIVDLLAGHLPAAGQR